jgi:hypothetical protein
MCTKFEEEAVLDHVSVGQDLEGPVSKIKGPSSSCFKRMLDSPLLGLLNTW